MLARSLQYVFGMNANQITVTYSCKHCKRVKQVVYPVRIETHEWNGHNYVTGKFALKNDSMHTEYKFGDGAWFCTPCECGKNMMGKEIVGKVNESVACNFKCTGAKGHVCECSCGGANHGAAHRVV
jgi:hypothetical protein